jgi:predicted PolB exonuclease-like 3'-5' exonuclease
MDTHNVLFLDIETVPQYEHYDLLPQEWKDAWAPKAQSIMQGNPEETVASSYQRAGLYAEFGKIACISTGYVKIVNGQKKLQHKSYYGNERKLLQEFAQDVNRFARKGFKLCAHSGKNFDFPFLFRRMIIQNVLVPSLLKIAGKKPWEIALLDTLDLWKCGDFKTFTSLKLLALAFGLPSPKDDIDGSMVAHVYYVEKNIERIVKYCIKDVVTLAKVYARIEQLPPIQEDDEWITSYPVAA